MKLLLRILFLLLPFLWSVMLLAQPNNGDCSTTCFSTEVVSAEKISETCTAYEWKVSYSGECQHALSHFTAAIPCGEISDLWNSENWKQEIGMDPTSGLTGFKIDDIQEFGETSLTEFTVKFTLCNSDESCAAELDCWQPVVAYKAATCVNYETLNITCNQLKASLQKTDISCYGVADGSLSVIVEEGTEPFTFLWADGKATSEVTDLAAGTYSVVVTDASGEELVLEETISQPSQIVIDGAITNASCSGAADGSIDITVIGGGGSYTYSWSNGADTEDIGAVSSGNYTVTVTDGKACSAQRTFPLTGDVTLSVTNTEVRPGCGASNGSLDITVAGGVEPYIYQWSNGGVTEDASGLSAGMHDVIVTDSRGCSIQKYFNLKENNTLSLSYTSTQTSCDAATGEINLSVNGGTLPYSFQWSNGDMTEDLSGLSSGTYTVTVADGSGCMKMLTASVTKKSFTISGSVEKPTCAGNSDGSITLNDPIGGEAPYTYQWSNGESGSVLTGLGSGMYSVTVTDNAGCTSQAMFVVSNPTAISASFEVTNANCNAEGSYNVDLEVSGGTAPYQFQWSDGNTNEDRESMTSGVHTLIITDVNGCSVEKEVNVQPTASGLVCAIQQPDSLPACGSTGNVLSTAVDADTYSWTVISADAGWQISGDASDNTITYATGGTSSSATFTLTLTKDGCTQTCSYTISTCVENDEENPENPDDGEEPGDGDDDETPGEGDDDGENPGDGEQPGDGDGSGNETCDECFDSSISIVERDGTCYSYEVIVNTTGNCRHDLSHWTIEIPCGTVSNIWNSEGWKIEVGSDPTTGLNGLKVDDISTFGKEFSSFIVRFDVCYESSCEDWEPVVAYKAGQCVGYDTLDVQTVTASNFEVNVYPNPFRDQISFEVTPDSDGKIRLEIFDQFGHPVARVVDGELQQGVKYAFEWTATHLNTGIYYYKLTMGDNTKHGKIFRK